MSLQRIAKIQHVVELAMEFINIKSITKNEYNMAQAVKAWLEARNWTVKLQLVETNRYNILAYPINTDPTNAQILINSHLDTVPPYIGPAKIKNNKIYGRGACDAKSIIASQLIASNILYQKHAINSIALLYTVGEETSSIGMITANKLNLNPAYIITGEPTESRTCIGQKGIYIFELISHGKAAHSAYPNMGQCALTPLLNILHAINNEKWPNDKIFGDTTANIWIQKGGIAANVIPEICSAKVLFRCSVHPKYIQNKIKLFIKKFDLKKQIQYKFIGMSKPIKYETVDDNKYNPMMVAFGTDIPQFKNVIKGKCKAVLFGPGSITVAHSDNEHIDIDELKKSVHTYQDIVLTLLSKSNLKARL
eukprot:173936_1